MQEMWVESQGPEDHLEKEMTIHSSILAWDIPWTRILVGYSTFGRKRFRHDLVTKQQLSILYSLWGVITNEPWIGLSLGYLLPDHRQLTECPWSQYSPLRNGNDSITSWGFLLGFNYRRSMESLAWCPSLCVLLLHSRLNFRSTSALPSFALTMFHYMITFYSQRYNFTRRKYVNYCMSAQLKQNLFRWRRPEFQKCQPKSGWVVSRVLAYETSTENESDIWPHWLAEFAWRWYVHSSHTDGAYCLETRIFSLLVPLSQINALIQWIFSSVSPAVSESLLDHGLTRPMVWQRQTRPLPSRVSQCTKEGRYIQYINWYHLRDYSVFSVMFWAGGDWPVSKRERSLRPRTLQLGTMGEDRDKYNITK